ncbi:uncharacterized protein LOC144152950 [Haemaphysalis longicornis]
MDFGPLGIRDFHVKPGNSPSTYTITFGEEPESFEARYYYTDYKNCVITDLNFYGYTCMLWSDRTVMDEVPQECIDQFVKTCGVVTKYCRHLCPDNERSKK